MQIQDFYNNIYTKLKYQTRILSPFRFMVRCLANFHIPLWFRLFPSASDSSSVGKDIIVSLTSFPTRISNLWIVIECILRQTMRPAKIVLWLSREQFPDMTSVPTNLRKYVSRGLDIRLVDGDVRSHKKYLYAFEEFKDKDVVLIDDDIFYHSTLIENLVSLRDKFSSENVVVCTYAYHIGYNSDGTLLPYSQWHKSTDASNDMDLFFGSGGGTLIRPSMLDSDWNKIDLALQLVPAADDIWLNAMVRLSDLRIVKAEGRLILDVHTYNNVKLRTGNVLQNRNDIQLSNIIEHYKATRGINVFASNS